MISPNPVLEVVYESAPNYAGLSGLWAVTARPGDVAHSLLVISFASGSRALSTGAWVSAGGLVFFCKTILVGWGFPLCAFKTSRVRCEHRYFYPFESISYRGGEF